MKTYTLYIQDGRYAAPTLLVVEMRDDSRVEEFARQRLSESPHYHAVEIWEDERRVSTVGSNATGDA